MTQLFEVEDRERVQERVLELASEDPRVVAGAIVGGLALGGGDRWSDLDLTFAVADDVPVADVLEDWTQSILEQLDALHLFDLPTETAIYRVFLLPGGLQFDLSFSSASQFAALSPRFRLLFGDTVEAPPRTLRPAADIFGWGVAWARDARACIDRGRLWQAEHGVSQVREHALNLACRRRGLPIVFGRGFDDLPAEVLAEFEGAFAPALERDALLRALERAVDGLFRESEEVGELAVRAEPRVRLWLAA